MITNELILAAERLRERVEPLGDLLVEEGLVDYSYNPLVYAWELHKAFIRLGGEKGAKTLLLGMNPGPHGMGQMGIPFSATSVVKNLLGINGIDVSNPKKIHPKRPVLGLDWPKQEVSGTRLWGVLEEFYGDIDEIFSNVFIVNHCPLMLFNGERATNITPDKLSGQVINEILDACDEHLIKVVEIMNIKKIIGVGKYAEKRALIALSHLDIEVTSCWHPSPASPLANRNNGEDWKENIKNVLPRKNDLQCD